MAEAAGDATTGNGPKPYVPPNPNHGLGADKAHRPAVLAPPTSHELALADRRLEQRLDSIRADFEAHSAEMHPRPLPNVVGSMQAQWAMLNPAIKQVLYAYGTVALIGLTIKLLQWFLASFRRRQDGETQPLQHIIMRQWPPQ